MADDRVATLTRDIAGHAQSKQLDSAREVYSTILREGLTPSRYTYSALINAHVNSGDLVGAARTLQDMEQAGFAPNLIVYTTLLKGHCAIGELVTARRLIEGMGRATPPIRPDARTLNTFMRGCVRVGDLEAARWAFGQLQQWRLVPGPASTVAFGRLLAQGLQLGELREALKEHTARSATEIVHRPSRTANPCMFWERGRCERGLSCSFYHDPAIKQADALQVEAAQRDTELELSVQLAHAAALLGRRSACKHALRRAEGLQAAAASQEASGAGSGWQRQGGQGWPSGGGWSSGGGGGGGEEREEMRYGTGLHAGFRRAELARDAARLSAYLEKLPRKKKAPPPSLERYLSRCLIFGTQLEQSGGGGGGGKEEAGEAGEEGGGRSRTAGAAVASRLLDALRRTAGLPQAARLGLTSEKRVRRKLAKAISKKGQLRWKRIFRQRASCDEGKKAREGGGGETQAKETKEEDLPIKIEVASGTGDWVIAQALADVGKASWASIELRHDRVYSTFARMALQSVPNLCVMGGDAAAIVRTNLKPRSVSHAFINFPEPPSGFEGYDASNELHLLTSAFFTDLHRVLRPHGMLTILSDNGRYSRTLAATLGRLRGAATGSAAPVPLMVSEELPDVAQYEEIEGVRLYHGVPGRECGHLQSESSYFDRLWEYRQGEETERFYMLLRRPQ
jgi:pentatricopeptide repeat protein